MTESCNARPASEIARCLGVDLTEWQAKWLDEVMERAKRGERPVYRFLGRKIGYGWAWEQEPESAGATEDA